MSQFNPISRMDKQTNTNNHQKPKIDLLQYVFIIGAVITCIIGVFAWINYSVEQEKKQENARIKRVRYHNLHQKKNKSFAEWAEFCELAKLFGSQQYAACDVLAYMDYAPTNPILVKGITFRLDFANLRHIADRHMMEYNNSNASKFNRGTTFNDIVQLMHRMANKINRCSNFEYNNSVAWQQFQKKDFYVVIDGWTYVLVVGQKNGVYRVITCYPTRRGAKINGEIINCS